MVTVVAHDVNSVTDVNLYINTLHLQGILHGTNLRLTKGLLSVGR